ncbi:DNA polymerase beta [Thecamonas trahens ATCC 50062]|uniref:DNA polymerase n=1 Tax=Thecamonas trahens ATCC 50062 TaxID=461836 RepID=A0A0L0DV30_THETB|nr:DNA polymerase beta [Thecamonas trahens ATCC 50062]KNC56060.1 DNA polymerase beta [Thecamonas trahens ATCC 50062]|eukprot:XP_013761104.1 DNA polymerase beta [Thecamonas trahens ATCC 50062]
MADNVAYTVEYARTGRAGCKLRTKSRKCPVGKIDKGVLRIGRVKPSFMSDDDDAVFTEWFHVPCWFDVQSRMRATSRKVESTDDLDGFEALTDADKALIGQYIDKRRSIDNDMAALASARPPPQPAAAAKRPLAEPVAAPPAKRQRPLADAGDLAAAALAAGKRICRYGASCYRENPDHLRDYWHPPGSRADGLTPQPQPAVPVVHALPPPLPASVPGSGIDMAAAAGIEASIAAKTSAFTGTASAPLIELKLHGNYNADITDLLEELGKIEKNKGNVNKHKAYMQAATSLQMLPRRVTSGADAKSLDGVGTKIAAKIDEILATGKLGSLERAKADKQLVALSEVCKVDGIGPVLARKLVYERGVMSLSDLAPHVDSFTTYQRAGLKYFDEFRQRIPRLEVEELERIAFSVLPSIDIRLRATVCGSYRRGAATCGDIDVLLTHPDWTSSRKGQPPFLAAWVAQLKAIGFLTDELGLGSHKYTGVCILPESSPLAPPRLHRRIDILWVPYDHFYFGLLYFTGSGFFNIQMRRIALDLGYTLNEHGMMPIDKETGAVIGDSVKVNSEEDIFRLLNMAYKSPPERDLASHWKPTMPGS